MRRLSPSDRAFFARVAQAAFENPFGEERHRIDAELAETNVDDPLVLERLSARLDQRLETLGREGRAEPSAYEGQDAELLRAAILFHVFHRFLAQIDLIIEAEMSERGPTRVPFAKAFFGALASYELRGREAVKMLELSYQVRRAHMFIRDRLVGLGPSMRRVREELWNAVFTRDIRRYERHLWNRMEDFSLLILGETGTGKGQAAMAVGYSSFIAFDEAKGTFARNFRDGFVPLNLSAFPETLIEAELFGHRKGAFTGAVDHHDGALARVPPFGSIFLDEIGEVTPALQVKLLRVLSERTYNEVGGHTLKRFDGRVMAATHRSIDELRSEGHMREDFFYRLCACTVNLPPLRVRLAEQPSELDALVRHMTERMLGNASEELSTEVTGAIRKDLGPHHAFPGNVRELEQCVRRVLLSGHCQDSHRPPSKHGSDGFLAAAAQEGLTAEGLVSRYCAMLYERSKSYVEVARITGLDRRTVKKHVEASG